MPGFFDWVSSGISTAVQPFVNWLEDPRNGNMTRPRAASSDPTQAIDKSSGTSILNFPHDRPKYYMTFAFEEYQRPTQFQGLQSSGLTDYICLPIPNNMRNQNTVNYDSAKEGHIIGEAAARMAQDGGLNALKTGGITSGTLQDLVHDTGEGAGGWGVNKLVQGLKAGESLLGESGLTDSALQVAGLADNPFMTVALKGPAFKQHHFQWRLAPKSSAETDTIKNIIGTFRKMMYPELLTLGAGGFFKYPHIVWPKFQPDGVINYTYSFKPCVITNFNENYTPNDRPGFYTTQAPIEIVIDIVLMEIELWRGGDNTPSSGLPTVQGDFSNVQTPPGRNG